MNIAQARKTVRSFHFHVALLSDESEIEPLDPIVPSLPSPSAIEEAIKTIARAEVVAILQAAKISVRK